MMVIIELRDAIRSTSDYAKFSSPSLKANGKWYWSYNSGLEAQSVIYCSKDGTPPTFGDAGDADGPGGDVFFDVGLLVLNPCQSY